MHASTFIATWLPMLLVALVAWRISRGGGGSAVQELSEANRVLEKRMHELGGQVRDLLVEKATLEQKTDYAAVMAEHEKLSRERHERVLKVLEEHFSRTLAILELIAERMGPDGAP